MKKYITMDFDEKGAPVMGQAKNTPANMAFIPTTWTPPAPVSEGSGLKSIDISPVLETTPALDSLFPVYLGDERIDEYDSFQETVHADSVGMYGDEYEITVTPSDDWIMECDGEHTGGNAPGEPITFNVVSDGYNLSIQNVWAENMKDYESPEYKVVYAGILITTS